MSILAIMILTSLGANILIVPMLTVAISCKLWFWITFLYLYRPTLSNIPGPKWASWTRLWLVKVLASGDSAQKFLDINRQYG